MFSRRFIWSPESTIIVGAIVLPILFGAWLIEEYWHIKDVKFIHNILTLVSLLKSDISILAILDTIEVRSEMNLHAISTLCSKIKGLSYQDAELVVKYHLIINDYSIGDINLFPEYTNEYANLASIKPDSG